MDFKMEQDEPFINSDVFNVHDIAEIEGKTCLVSLEKYVLRRKSMSNFM